jgi:hypothetical protein
LTRPTASGAGGPEGRALACKNGTAVWEEISALATLFTGVAIVATVLLGIRQLRLTADQLDHLRRATQLEGAMKIFDDFNTPEFRESFFFIMNELAKQMEDETFRADVALIGIADNTVHKELHLMRTFERVGTYVKHGLIEGAIIYDYSQPPIVRSWDALAEVVRIHRAAHGEAFWENFELLYREAVRFRDSDPGSATKTDDPAP